MPGKRMAGQPMSLRLQRPWCRPLVKAGPIQADQAPGGRPPGGRYWLGRLPSRISQGHQVHVAEMKILRDPGYDLRRRVARLAAILGSSQQRPFRGGEPYGSGAMIDA